MLNKKRLVFLLLLSFLVAVSVLPAFAESWRWTGRGVSGNVETKVFNKVRMVAAEQIARDLGYKTEVQKEELLIRGKAGLRFVNGASVAWLGYSVVPLKSKTRMEKGGHWWIAADSAMDIFSQFLSKNGRNIQLQWAGKAQPAKQVAQPASNLPETARNQPQVPAADLPRAAGLRWGIPGPDIIRAVIDLEGEEPPKYDMAGNTVTVNVASIDKSVTTTGFPKYPDISVKLRKGSPAAIEFAYRDRSVNVFTLKDPFRLVVDFRVSEGGAVQSGEVKKPEPVSEKKPEKKAEKKPEKQTEAQPVKATATEPKVKKGARLVVIDAGHGGKDPGAVANGYQEKKIALEISNRIASELRKRGVTVKMTRTGDTYPSLRDRTTMANSWNADVFISVHLNALPKGRHATGTEIYLMALPTDKDAMELAKFENAEFVEGSSSKKSDSRTELLLSILGDMQQNAKIGESTYLAEDLFRAGQDGGLNMRRVAQAPFWVLRGAAMPAVLIETGFITEMSDVRQLAKPVFQQKMAEAFASGIVKFLNR